MPFSFKMNYYYADFWITLSDGTTRIATDPEVEMWKFIIMRGIDLPREEGLP
jgi:uncharacterized protein YecA (UPF0149 family)